MLFDAVLEMIARLVAVQVFIALLVLEDLVDRVSAWQPVERHPHFGAFRHVEARALGIPPEGVDAQVLELAAVGGLVVLDDRCTGNLTRRGVFPFIVIE